MAKGAFIGSGGVTVASCFNKKVAEMREEVRARGHSTCVTYIPGDEQLFALHFGQCVEKYAKEASVVVVIVGDDRAEGKWQQKEMAFLLNSNIEFEKMTLAEYKARWPTAGASPGGASAWRDSDKKTPSLKVQSGGGESPGCLLVIGQAVFWMCLGAAIQSLRPS
jgi:hypothetical protein